MTNETVGSRPWRRYGLGRSGSERSARRTGSTRQLPTRTERSSGNWSQARRVGRPVGGLLSSQIADQVRLRRRLAICTRPWALTTDHVPPLGTLAWAQAVLPAGRGCRAGSRPSSPRSSAAVSSTSAHPGHQLTVPADQKRITAMPTSFTAWSRANRKSRVLGHRPSIHRAPARTLSGRHASISRSRRACPRNSRPVHEGQTPRSWILSRAAPCKSPSSDPGHP